MHCYRNKQKKAKKARHVREKEYMEELRGFGHAVGEYVGEGMGDVEDDADKLAETDNIVDAELDHADAKECSLDEEREEDRSEKSYPLLFFFDCEATGLSIYHNSITEVAAKVVGVTQSSVSQPSFSSLIHTPRNIPRKGNKVTLDLSITKWHCVYTHIYTCLQCRELQE